MIWIILDSRVSEARLEKLLVKQQKHCKRKPTFAGAYSQPMLFHMDADEQISVSLQGTWLSDIVSAIENEIDTTTIADYILPLLLYKHFSDTLDSSSTKHIEDSVPNTHSFELFQMTNLERERIGPLSIHIPDKYSWDAIRNYPPDGTLGQFLISALHEVAQLNPQLQGVVDAEDYDKSQSGQQMPDDKLLKKVIDIISLHPLDTQDGSLEVLNAACEYLLQHLTKTKENVARFFTPQTTVRLVLDILETSLGSLVYDPACGSGMGLHYTVQALRKKSFNKVEELKLYGQENTSIACTMAKINMLLQDSSVVPRIVVGDALRNPSFINADGSLMQFDRILANPPWNLKGYDKRFYETDTWDRFKYGTPPEFSADWGWVQHILASLNEEGRASVLLDIGATSRGSKKEREIRRTLVEQDFIEGVILLPGKLFHDTAAPCVAIILRKNKPPERKNQILFVDVLDYALRRGVICLSNEDIEMIYKAYSHWETQQNFCQVVTLEELRSLNYDLSPLLLVEKKIETCSRSLHEIERDITDAIHKLEDTDTVLLKILNPQDLSNQVGLGGTPLMASYPLLRVQSTTAKVRQARSEGKKQRKHFLTLEQERRDTLMHQFFTYGIGNELTHLTALGQIPVDWTVIRLRELAKIRSGFTPSPSELKREGKQIPWVRASDLYQEYVTKSARTIPESVTDTKNIRHAIRPVNTVLLAVYGGPSTVGKTGLLKVEAATNQSVCCVFPDPEFLDPYYLLCYFTYIRSSWLRYAIGSRLNITMNIVKERLIPLPSIQVQQEIGNRLQPINAILHDLEQEIATTQGGEI